MNEFRKNFVRECLVPLRKLRETAAADLSDDVRREALRLVHTIKGCSRTFGLKQSGEIAAELESILADENFNATSQIPVLEYLTLLIEALQNPMIGATSIGKTRTREMVLRSTVRFRRIAPEVFSQLSERERSQFFAALEDGREVFLVRVSLSNDNLADGFRAVRDRLTQNGDVIAALPDSIVAPGKTAFRILATFPTGSSPDGFNCESLVVESPDQATGDLLLEVAKHVERLAHDASKCIHFRALANDVEIGDKAHSVFEILLHLTSNAVDHGIETAGTIELLILRDGSRVTISVADNGVGIDLAERAVDFDPIFEPGFTTARSNAKNSGLGYGLFIIKTEVEKLNGKICISSRKDFGTRVEITLPV